MGRRGMAQAYGPLRRDAPLRKYSQDRLFVITSAELAEVFFGGVREVVA